MIAPKPLPFVLPKKKPFPRKIPEVRREGERKRMTLVSTLIGREGLVMFSDNQETRGGYSKTTVDKLCVWDIEGMPFRIAISGSTDNAMYLDMLDRTISADLLRLNEYSMPLIEEELSKTLTSFYSKHIWQQPAAPQLDFLIAIQPLPSGRPQVIHVSGTAVLVSSLTEHYKCIGVGSYLANYLFNLFVGGGETQAELAIAAAYIGQQVNQNVEGCGPIERIVLLGNNGEYGELSSDHIRQIEKNLAGLRQVLEYVFIAAANVTDVDGLRDDLKYIRDELEDVRTLNVKLWAEIQDEIGKHAQNRSRFFMPRMRSSPF